MSDEQTVNWEAALAEVDARIAKLQTFADGIREMMASGTTGPAPGSGPGRDALGRAEVTLNRWRFVEQADGQPDVVSGSGGVVPSRGDIGATFESPDRAALEALHARRSGAIPSWWTSWRACPIGESRRTRFGTSSRSTGGGVRFRLIAGHEDTSRRCGPRTTCGANCAARTWPAGVHSTHPVTRTCCSRIANDGQG